MEEGRGAESGSEAGAPDRLSENVLRHFGFSVDPFAAKHNPKFLLRSKPLRGALESLHQCVGEGAKLLVVVGEPGSGRSALVDAIARDFKDGIRTARIERPIGTWAEIGAELGRQLRLRGDRLSPGAMTAEGGCAQTYRVIVNHAELMNPDAIKHLGAYLDLEAAPGKLVHRLQVILMTQDDMGVELSRWLTRRDYAHVDLELLGDEQSRRYITRRAQLAQSSKHEIFLSDALARIAELSGGNPARINHLCRAALELAASRGSDIVDAETVGTALRRAEPAAVPAAAPAPEPAPVVGSVAPVAPVAPPAPIAAAPPPPAAPAEIVEETMPMSEPDYDPHLPPPPPPPREPARSARVEVMGPPPQPRESNSVAYLATFCALLLGIIAGGAGFLYFQEQAPPPEPVTHVVEVPVEKIVEVPVEVVKVVRVEVPPAPKPTPKPRAPKPKPVKVAKVAPPPPPAKLAPAPKPRGIGPIPPAAEALDRAFEKARPGNHVRRVEILKHSDDGVELIQTLDLARVRYLSRTMTVGILTGDVSSDAREVESRFLSIETGEVEDDRFGYRPARGTLEPLKSGKGRDPFYGSSFHYDDFRLRKASHFVIHGIDRSRVGSDYFYSVSAKPRYQADYERVDFTIHAADEVIVEAHYFRGRGLRPYRIVQYPRDNMESYGEALVPMRVISRDFVSNTIEEARVVKVTLDNRLDRRLFTLDRVKSAHLEIPNL